jgi:predicted transposase YbfD/YdcC
MAVIIAGSAACSITGTAAVSACPSSPIIRLAARSDAAPGTATAPVAELARSDLLVALAAVPDPRASRGVRYRLVTVLAAAVCAVLAGARSYVAIAEWAADLPVSVPLQLGMGRRAPSETTVRRLLQAVDPDALDRAVTSWIARRATTAPTGPAIPEPAAAGSEVGAGSGVGVRAIALDGKTARGARRNGADGRAVHLFAALDHASGVVLGQTEIDAKTNEITAFTPLCDRVADLGIDLAEVVVTADALHCQDRHAHDLHARGAHYVFVVKANGPGLRAQLRELPWPEIPVVHTAHDRGHGRIETRTLQLTALAGGFGFPHARLAARIVRRRRPLAGAGRWHTETVHAVTSLGYSNIRADQLAEIIRGHWRVENQLHWVRDVTFAEDHSQIRAGTGPATMAVLRNFAISRHRLAGATNIARACRDTSRHPLRAAELLK